MLGWLVGLARTGLALVLQIAINVINMAATAWLVLYAGRGVDGAALGSVIAEIAGFVASLAVAFVLLRGRAGFGWHNVLDRAKIVRMLAINRDIMIRTFALIAAFASSPRRAPAPATRCSPPTRCCTISP